MKKIIVFCTALCAICSFYACEQENADSKYAISKLEALEIVKPLLNQWPDNLVISRSTIPANKTLKYGPFGHYKSSDPNSGTTKSPNYKSWLIVRIADPQVDDVWESRHFFVNVETGSVQEKSLYGYVEGITWDDETIHQAFYGNGKSPEYDDYPSLAPSTAATKSGDFSSSGKYAVIISGGADKENNWRRYWNDCQYISECVKL